MSGASYNKETTWSDLYFPSQRFVDLNYLARNLWCSGCNQPLSLRNLVDDRFEESQLQLLCSWCEAVIGVSLIAPASAQFHKQHSLDKPKFGKTYSRQGEFVITEEENEIPSNFKGGGILRRSRKGRFLPRPKDKWTVETKQNSTKTEPKQNVAALNRPLSPEPSNSRSILKKNLRSNISENHRQEHEPSECNSDNGQDFGFDFQEALPDDDEKEHIGFEYSSDTALAGAGDKQEYEIPEWALRPVLSFNFPCGYCFQLFDNPVSRHQHFKDHSEFNNFICWCGKKSSSRYIFGHHRSLHRNGNLCHTCGKLMTGTKHFSNHLIICGDLGETLQCELCSKMFKTEHSLKVHARAHATRKLECAHCSKKFLEKSHLVKHMALHTKDFTYTCHLCPAKFTRADNLKAHVENNHRYMCFLCRKQFSSADLARLHVQTSHTQAEIAASGTQSGFMRITKFECTFCGRCLASKQALQNHEKTHQKNAQASGECESDKDQSSGVIGKKQLDFTDYARLHSQAEIAASGQPSGFVRITKFECTVCGTCFDSKQLLQTHEKTHQENAPVTRQFEQIKTAPFPDFSIYHTGC